MARVVPWETCAKFLSFLPSHEVLRSLFSLDGSLGRGTWQICLPLFSPHQSFIMKTFRFNPIRKLSSYTDKLFSNHSLWNRLDTRAKKPGFQGTELALFYLFRLIISLDITFFSCLTIFIGAITWPLACPQRRCGGRGLILLLLLLLASPGLIRRVFLLKKLTCPNSSYVWKGSSILVGDHLSFSFSGFMLS